MNLQQILGTVQTIAELIAAGKLAADQVVSFLRSSGADTQQLERNRVILASDITSIDQELTADGINPATGDPFVPPVS